MKEMILNAPLSMQFNWRAFIGIDKNRKIRRFIDEYCSYEHKYQDLSDPVIKEWLSQCGEAFAGTTKWIDDADHQNFRFTWKQPETLYAIQLNHKQGNPAVVQSLDFRYPIDRITLLDNSLVSWNQSRAGLELLPVSLIKSKVLIYKITLRND
jgi:hypothetical protein